MILLTIVPPENMRSIFALLFLLIQSLGFGQHFYDGAGRQVARFDDNRVYNGSGKPFGRANRLHAMQEIIYYN